jgi:hypothetical protein
MKHKALVRRLQISCLGLDPVDPLRLLVDDVIEALREHAMREVQRLGQEIEQEPVAIKRMKEWIEYLKRKSDFGQHMKIPSEMSAGICWELAIELEQFINTTPPQRTWVGLTDDEIIDVLHPLVMADMSDEATDYEIARAIEAKLKQKNGYAEEKNNAA